MEYTTENTYLQIVRLKDDNDNDGWGTAIKCILMPSQFYVIEKKPEIASSFYHGLAEPTLVFTQTRSAQKFLLELVLSKVESKDGCLFYKRKTKHAHTGSFNVDALCKQINVLENRQMWIDDSEIQSVTELCEKCRRMKEEHHIQFAVIDDFMHLPTPESVLKGMEAPDAAYRQLCQLAKELDIVVVALLDPCVNHPDEDHPSHQKKKHTQGKGLDSILARPD